MKRFKGKFVSLYTYECPYCGYRVKDCYDDPFRCPNCGK